MHTDIKAALVGVVLAFLTIIPLYFLFSQTKAIEVLAVSLGAIGTIYVGFALVDGSTHAMSHEIPQGVVFLTVALLALWSHSTLITVLGYIAHGVWDMLHHSATNRIVKTHVPGYYPAFCGIYDVAIALLVLLVF